MDDDGCRDRGAFHQETSTTEVGREGEARAALELRRRGWEVLSTNWRDGSRELDLVIRRSTVLAFVEVKRRGGGALAHPLAAVHRRKRRDVERAAAAWLVAHPARCRGVETFRFDTVAVLPGPGGDLLVDHIPDAWRRGE